MMFRDNSIDEYLDRNPPIDIHPGRSQTGESILDIAYGIGLTLTAIKRVLDDQYGFLVGIDASSDSLT